MDADRDRRVCADVRGWDGIRFEEVPSVDGHHLDRRRLFPGARRGRPGLSPQTRPLVPVNPRELARSLHFPLSRSSLVSQYGQFKSVEVGSNLENCGSPLVLVCYMYNSFRYLQLSLPNLNFVCLFGPGVIE